MKSEMVRISTASILLGIVASLPMSVAAQVFELDPRKYPVTFDPPSPQAFQSFDVSFVAYPLEERPLSIKMEGNMIVIDYTEGSDEFATMSLPTDRVRAHIDGLAPGEYVVRIFKNFSPNDRLPERFHLKPEPDWPLSIAEAPPSVPIHAFYNGHIRHYFITASPAERERVLRAEAGWDWYVLGENFQVWPADGPAPDAAQAVCRFYSASANSHFYTVEGAECEALRQPGSGWAYEGIAFRTLVAKAGSCPQGTDPVWRLYNNRAAENDSNHRFTASTVDYRSMIESGWIGEGAVFCSPR